MFDLLNFKKRLKSIRSELAEIDDKAEVYSKDEQAPESIRFLSLSICKIASILVRVIDSLPGG